MQFLEGDLEKVKVKDLVKGDLENRVRGPSRSLDISPFHSAHTISY